MAYIDDLRKVEIKVNGNTVEAVGGSFRGVPFFVAAHTYGSGRRIAVHELPGAMDPENEDRGRVSRSVTLEAYLVGEDVQDQKEKFLSACEKEGTGKLVHPYMGTKNAQCPAIEITETNNQKRWVQLALTFVLDPDIKKKPKQTTDLGALTETVAQSGLDDVASKFEKAFSLVGAAQSTVQSAVDLSNDLLDGVESVRDSMRQVSDFVETIGQLRQNMELLLLTPASFARQVQNLITLTGDVLGLSSEEEAALYRTQLRESLSMATLGADTSEVPNTGANERKKQAANQAALLNLFQQTATFSSAQKMLGAEVTSVQDAGEIQTQMDDTFDEILQTTDDPDIYQRIQDTQSAALAYLRETSADLAVVLTYTPRRTVPSLVLSFEIYGTYTRAADLVSRNDIPHPGFLDGGVPLEVLSK